MSLINRHRAAAGETPEQTLARLAAASRVADGPAPDQPRRPRFKVVKMAEGYNMAEVDAFIDTIDQRTADEVREVHFSTVRLTRGYDEDEVDRFLDEQVAHLGDDGCVEPRTSSPRPAGGKVLPSQEVAQVDWPMPCRRSVPRSGGIDGDGCRFAVPGR